MGTGGGFTGVLDGIGPDFVIYTSVEAKSSGYGGEGRLGDLLTMVWR